jgi:hypothetical protein
MDPSECRSVVEEETASRDPARVDPQGARIIHIIIAARYRYRESLRDHSVMDPTVTVKMAIQTA